MQARQFTVTHVEGSTFSFTVMRRDDGHGCSKWLHGPGSHLVAADALPVVGKALLMDDVGGTVTIDHLRERIAKRDGRLLLVSAGIGITPMFGCLNKIFTDPMFHMMTSPPLHIAHLHSVRDATRMPYSDEVRQWCVMNNVDPMDIHEECF
jgi:ferredoxin-NADP reductase